MATQKKLWKRLIIWSLLILVVFVGALIAMFSTDKGSKFLLDRVLESQKMIRYHYEGGSLLRGLILSDIDINLDDIEVKLKHADVVLGWRAILDKEVHLHRADIQQLEIINKKPSSNTPFEFSDIKMPVTLRIDEANLDKLILKTQTSSVDFNQIYLKDALWQGTNLSFKDARLNIMDYVLVKQAKGQIDFSQKKYPLHATAKVNIPALHSINIQDITLVATGSLDTLTGGFATHTPDLVTGRVIMHPVRDNVPMRGQVNFKNYHLPFAQEQELFVQQGTAYLNGSASDMHVNLRTDLKGKDVPYGNYQSELYVDYAHELQIKQFTGHLLEGDLNLQGVLNWEKALRWEAQGRLNHLKADQTPEMVREFLPKDLTGKFGVTGNLDKGTHLDASLDFDKYESWKFKLNQTDKPLVMNVAWQNMNRAMPYIGWLNSPTGQADITLKDNQQDIKVNTQIQQHEQGTLPTGQYIAQLNIKDNDLKIPDFKYITSQGGLNGRAMVYLPTQKRQLKWDADLVAKNFNPQTLATAAPVDLINGHVKANGYAEPDKQIIALKGIDLTGRLAQQNETVHLTGDSTASILLKKEGGLKGYGVVYDGGLTSSQFKNGDGLLKIKVAGTPDSVKISEFRHEGVAGKILADGVINLKNGIDWNVNASLVRFKPQYFTSSVKGEVSGVVKSTGLWADHAKKININNLNLAGVINNHTLRGTGNLALSLKAQGNTFVPQQFDANNLFLAYAGNQIQATGNAQNLNIKVNAPSLYNLYAGLRGRVYGYVNLQTQPKIKATANLAVDGFGYNNTVSIEKMRIQGELPTSETTPTMLKAEINNLRSGNRQIQYGAVRVSGTRNAHLVALQGWNNSSKFYVQLAGGFNPQNDWVGQIQKGTFDSVRAVLNQQQNANVIYHTKDKSLYVGEHCWASNQSRLCFDKPIQVSPTKGDVSFLANNLNLNDFAAFMPEGFAITGQLNGYAKASWAQGQKPNIDAKLITQNGKIGIASDDPDDPSTTTSYEQISLMAKSVADGLQIRTDLKTASIGTGYANVTINPYNDALPMKGDVAFSQVNLQFLKPFIQGVRNISGTLDFAGKINGTVSKPLMTGDLRLKDGAISMISLPVNLTNIQMYTAIRQDQATLMGIFNSGQGKGKIDGTASWGGEPRIQLKLQGDELLIRQAPLVTAVVNTQMNVDVLPMQRRVSVKGNIEIPRAIINMPETSPNVVALSPDVRVVHTGDDPLAILRAAKPWNINADIDLQLGKKVLFQGFNSRIPLTGRLYLSQRGLETAMSANGAIGVSQKVKIEAYGQSLDLNRAIARFDGALANPTLDIDTNKKISSTLVGVRVVGTASSPQIQIYNDGGLSEQEALNALLTGRINEGSSSLSQTEGFKSDVNNTLAAAGLSLGLGGTRAFTNQLGRTFGLNGLALDAQGTGDDTQVSVTGYITPDLYLRYGVGVFTPVNKLTLRYQMNKRLYLEASQSVERAVDVFYNWRF